VKTIWINATQSEYDAQNLYTGWHDPELTEQGVTEATQIAKDLSDKYSEVADVYCSDLRRSFNTAKIICDNTNWNKTQQVSPRLLEIVTTVIYQEINWILCCYGKMLLRMVKV
jgi:bisphosphoglycerate-dependent phosphoglycerate mutase